MWLTLRRRTAVDSGPSYTKPVLGCTVLAFSCSGVDVVAAAEAKLLVISWQCVGLELG